VNKSVSTGGPVDLNLVSSITHRPEHAAHKAEIISFMTIWEYAILEYGIRPPGRRSRFPEARWMEPGNLQEYHDLHIHYLLNQAGTQGWELVGTHVSGDHPQLPMIVYTFKRPQQGSYHQSPSE
jgi:hypothetical protein